MQTHTHTQHRGPVVYVLALVTVGWLVCWTQGSKRKMVCVISPFLPSFAFDSKMDDCNHKSHQWDKMEVYGAVRHIHGNPPVRLLHHATMGTVCCLFVKGFCCFICICLSFPLLCSALWCAQHESVLIKYVQAVWKGRRRQVFTFHSIVSLL